MLKNSVENMRRHSISAIGNRAKYIVKAYDEGTFEVNFFKHPQSRLLTMKKRVFSSIQSLSNKEEVFHL